MSPDPNAAPTGTLRWLVRLRWAAIAGQLLVVAFARLAAMDSFGLSWPLGIVALVAASNVALHARSARMPPTSERLLPFVLLFDVAALTVLLALTGGSGNPFSVVYLVQVTLAAVVLGARWTWALVVATVTAFGALFLEQTPHSMHMHGGAFPLHLQGMWLAFAITAALLAYFVTRIAAELRAREKEILALQERAAKSDKLASLSTLAAGAAHELGTPLGTIAIAAKELERSVAGLDRPSLADDARLIRTEVDRCRGILNQLSEKAGESAGEMSVPTRLEELSMQLRESLAQTERERVRVSADPGVVATIPRAAVTQALRTLVRNGLEASEGDVRVSLAREGQRVAILVEDRGTGMDAHVLARAGEPFFTTKPPGQGLGLGLFLARAVAERLGGSLELVSTPGKGTVAKLELPGADK